MPSAFHARNDPAAPDQNVDRGRYLKNNALTVPANVVHSIGAASNARVAYRTVVVNIALSRFGTRLKCKPLGFQFSLLSGSPIGDRSHPITPNGVSQGCYCIEAARVRLAAFRTQKRGDVALAPRSARYRLY